MIVKNEAKALKEMIEDVVSRCSLKNVSVEQIEQNLDEIDIILDGMFSLTTMIEEKKESKGIVIILYRIKTDPGCRYHADGSGTPPCEDYQEIEDFDIKDKADAVRALFEYYFKRILDIAFEERQIDMLEA